LQTIYEQLLRSNLADMAGEDTSTSETQGITNSLVFKAGNVISIYIRPRLFFKMDTLGGIENMNSAVGDALGVSGTVFDNSHQTDTGDGGNNARIHLFNKIFSTNNSGSAPEGYKWLAGRTRHSGNLNQWETNYSKTDDVLAQLNAAEADGMLDGHVWKIDITL
jgi:hypothetical protein